METTIMGRGGVEQFDFSLLPEGAPTRVNACAAGTDTRARPAKIRL